MDDHDAREAGEVRPGWVRARPDHIPRPTYWPAVLALGVTFALWGLITTWVISIVGLALMAIATAGWMAEWRHEQDHETPHDD